jgi:2-octaprenylphenol hydroxylase
VKFDLVIVGGGLIGSSLALALKDSGLELALVERELPEFSVTEDWDVRVYSLSPGSARFLERCGIWNALDRLRITPVLEMEVFGDRPSSRIAFSAYDAHVPELAWIVENRLLQRALSDAVAAQENVVRFCPSTCRALAWERECVYLELEDGQSLRAQLIVGADGPDSWVRRESGIETEVTAYDQMGVVANFATEKPHLQIARQWFRADGVLAYLPLPGEHVSIVFSTPAEHARDLIERSPAQFAAEIAEAGRHSLGELRLTGARAAFPLSRMRVEQLVLPRVALLGDAAHIIHPLAGQGVNLGFRDADALAQTLLNRVPGVDCGDYALLRRYERARKEDILVTTWLTDALARLFADGGPLLSWLRNTGLSLTDRLPVIKPMLVQHALA